MKLVWWREPDGELRCRPAPRVRVWIARTERGFVPHVQVHWWQCAGWARRTERAAQRAAERFVRGLRDATGGAETGRG